MKKLIALAVAAASVPAMAAVSVSGATEFSYSDKAAATTAGIEQTVITVSGSSELDNGMTISASSSMLNNGTNVVTDNGDTAITLAGSFGTLNLGDVAGPLDALDGAAIATAENDKTAGGGDDMAVRYDLPTIVEGLSLHIGWTPEDNANGTVADNSGFGAKYSMAGFSVYYASEEYGNTEVDGYGASYSANGFTVGANASNKDVAGTETEKTGFSAGYTTGNLTVAYNSVSTDGADLDEATVSVAYSMGGGVTVYAASTSADVAATEEDTVGIKFSF